MRTRCTEVLAACAASAISAGAVRAQACPDWPMLGGNARHTGVTNDVPRFGSATIVTLDETGEPITFSPQSAPVVGDTGGAYALGSSRGDDRLYLISGGSCLWSAVLTPRVLDSWSSPAISTDVAAVYAASGEEVRAFDLAGTPLWSSPLDRPVVNASPTPYKGAGGARLFITDYDGFGPSASLYCINIDAMSPTNPYQPGERVWTAPIGSSSGNTPAIAGDLVIVATASGELLAYDADAGSPQLVWGSPLPESQASFAGVSVADGFVYAATFAFFGGHNNSRLCKFDAETGALIWAVPCARTSSIPLPLSGGRVLLSAGIKGFGTAPTVQMFEDLGSSAMMLWDTAIDTWNDANSNGALDPGEYLALGSWTHHPLYIAPFDECFVGVPDLTVGSFAPYKSLARIDLTKTPTEPGFAAETPGGSGPAIRRDSMFAIGLNGLVITMSACHADCDETGSLDFFDFLCFQSLFAVGSFSADCDGDCSLTFFDFLCFQNEFAGGCP